MPDLALRLAAVLIAAACFCAPSRAAAEMKVIRGEVVRGGTGEPITEGQVSFSASD